MIVYKPLQTIISSHIYELSLLSKHHSSFRSSPNTINRRRNNRLISNIFDLVCLCTHSLEEGSLLSSNLTMKFTKRLTSRLRCSMNTCKLTSSVKIAWPVAAPAELPYMLVDICVVDGLSLDNKKRACEPPWSQTMYRGIGKRSTRRSCSKTDKQTVARRGISKSYLGIN